MKHSADALLSRYAEEIADRQQFLDGIVEKRPGGGA